MGDDTGETFVRRKVKDSVFTDLFGTPKYLLEFYRSLHPEDEGIGESDLKVSTLDNVLTNQVYNDLGFTVGERAVVLAEAQTVWSANILPRCLLYLAETYKRWFHDSEQLLFMAKPVRMPRPELYVLCPRPGAPREAVSLSEVFFGGAMADLELVVHPIVPDGGSDIAQQYLEFCRVVDEQVATHGRTREALELAIRICVQRGILTDYLRSKRAEVLDMMSYLFDEEYIAKAYDREVRKQATAEGRAEGRAEGEGMLGRLVAVLLGKGKVEEATRAATDAEYRQRLYAEYGIA